MCVVVAIDLILGLNRLWLIRKSAEHRAHFRITKEEVWRSTSKQVCPTPIDNKSKSTWTNLAIDCQEPVGVPNQWPNMYSLCGYPIARFELHVIMKSLSFLCRVHVYFVYIDEQSAVYEVYLPRLIKNSSCLRFITNKTTESTSRMEPRRIYNSHPSVYEGSLAR